MVKYRGLTPNVYISPTGNDSTGDGSNENPYLTIDKAVTESEAGDVIGFKNGTYNMTTQNQYNMNAVRHYVGEDYMGVVIDGSSYAETNNTSIIRCGVDGSNTSIQNIRFQNLKWANNGDTSDVFRVLTTDNPGVLSFVGCVFNDLQSQSGTGASNRTGVFGRQQSTFRIKFVDCLMYGLTNFTGAHSQVFNCWNVAMDLEMTNTTIVFNTETNGTDKLMGSLNTVNRNNLADVDVAFRFKNCIIMKTVSYAVQFAVDSQANQAAAYRADNSCFFDLSNMHVVLGDNFITSDPKLIDPNLDVITDPLQAFALQRISPCLGTGGANI